MSLTRLPPAAPAKPLPGRCCRRSGKGRPGAAPAFRPRRRAELPGNNAASGAGRSGATPWKRSRESTACAGGRPRPSLALTSSPEPHPWLNQGSDRGFAARLCRQPHSARARQHRRQAPPRLVLAPASQTPHHHHRSPPFWGGAAPSSASAKPTRYLRRGGNPSAPGYFSLPPVGARAPVARLPAALRAERL